VGSHLWRLALALAARGEDGVDAADSVFIELALSDAYDADVRRAAIARLFDERVAAGQDAGWFDGAPPGGIVRLQVGEGGRIETMTSDAPQDPRASKSAQPPVDEATRSRNRLAALERVWLKLPPTPETVRTGLELSERWRALGDETSARRVADQAAKLAPKAPGAADDPELTGRLAVRAGEAACRAGTSPPPRRRSAMRKARARRRRCARRRSTWPARRCSTRAASIPRPRATTRSPAPTRPAASPTTRSSACT
jgi:hypothetical protein